MARGFGASETPRAKDYRQRAATAEAEAEARLQRARELKQMAAKEDVAEAKAMELSFDVEAKIGNYKDVISKNLGLVNEDRFDKYNSSLMKDRREAVSNAEANRKEGETFSAARARGEAEWMEKNKPVFDKAELEANESLKVLRAYFSDMHAAAFNINPVQKYGSTGLRNGFDSMLSEIARTPSQIYDAARAYLTANAVLAVKDEIEREAGYKNAYDKYMLHYRSSNRLYYRGLYNSEKRKLDRAKDNYTEIRSYINGLEKIREREIEKMNKENEEGTST